MRALVTGAASFIGGHLTEALLRRADTVVAVDGISDYYPAPIKKRNLAEVGSGLEPIEADLATPVVFPLLDGADVVFHLAGQPGVRASWGTGFAPYVQANIVATQRVLEACPTSQVTRFVNSSSSSVYGSATRFPTNEEDRTRPFSPYGVTKLAAEHLCSLYADNWGVAGGVAAVLHRVWAAAASHPGAAPNDRGRVRAGTVPPVRRRPICRPRRPT